MVTTSVYLGAARAFLARFKWAIIVGALALTHYAAYSYGQKSVYKSIIKGESKALVKEQKRSVASVKKASEDTRSITSLERDGEKQVEQLDAIPNRVKCPMSDDELRILESIKAKSTSTVR